MDIVKKKKNNLFLKDIKANTLDRMEIFSQTASKESKRAGSLLGDFKNANPMKIENNTMTTTKRPTYLNREKQMVVDPSSQKMTLLMDGEIDSLM